MRREPVVTWVVYEKQMPGKPKVTVMCEQSEWDALELTQPNPYTLVRDGITNEGEAERLARSGAVVVKVKERSRAVPAAAEALPPPGRDARHTAMATFCEQARRAAAAERPCQEPVVRG
jgi:hypothetical protein